MNIKLIFRTMGGDGDEGPGAAVQVMGPLGGTQVCNKPMLSQQTMHNFQSCSY